MKKNCRLISIVLSIILCLCINTWAFEAKREVSKRNGLTIIHFERKDLPLVKAVLLLDASPMDELKEKAGVAHLTAEMLLEGTKTRTSAQISQDMEFMAADIGVETDADYTAISLFTLKKDFKRGFEIFSDVIQNPIFPSKEFTRKKEILLGTLKQMEESPSFIASKAFKSELFKGHPYGRVIMGDPVTISNIKEDDLKTFHRDFYIPKRAILAVVGDISFEETLKIVDQYLSGWGNNTVEGSLNDKISISKQNEYPSIPTKKVIAIDRPLTQATIMLGNIGIKRKDPDYYKLSVMNYILGGGGFTSRLMQTVRNKYGYAYDIHSYFKSNKYGGYFAINVQTKNDLSDKVIKETLNEEKKIKTANVSVDDLSDAKSFLTGYFPLRLDTLSEIANFLAMTEFYGFGLNYDKDYIKNINDVTIDDVRDVASRYLDDAHYLLVIVGDMKKINMSKIQ